MKEYKLNVYADDGVTVVKTLTGTEFDLTFGTVRKLMKLLKIDKAENSFDLLVILNDAWEEITAILGKIFADATDDDWDHIKLEELLPLVVRIAKYSLSKALSIPTEKN